MNTYEKLLWLDDVRYPPTNDWHWVKTAEEAIEFLKDNTQYSIFASLDHDLEPKHYGDEGEFDYFNIRNKAGWAVTNFLEAQCLGKGNWSVLPDLGVRVHSMNPYGARKMLDAIQACYGHNFQCANLPRAGIEVLPWQLTDQPNGWFRENTTPSMIERYRGARHSL